MASTCASLVRAPIWRTKPLIFEKASSIGAPCQDMWRSGSKIVGQVRYTLLRRSCRRWQHLLQKSQKGFSQAQSLDPEVGHALDHQPVLSGAVRVVQPGFGVRFQEGRGVLPAPFHDFKASRITA